MPRMRNNRYQSPDIETQPIDTTLTTTPQQTQFITSNNIITRFNGKADNLKISAWLNVFEALTADLNDKRRIQFLVRHLDGTAFNWFASEVLGDIDSLTWTAVRSKFIARFGEPTVRPLITAQKRHLLASEDVQTYYNEKMELLRQTNLPDEDIIALLTEGMPRSYQTNLVVARLRSPTEWLTVALQLEEVNTRSRIQNRRFINLNTDQRREVFNTTLPRSTQTRNNAVPTVPCRFCQRRGQTIYHWHSECPHRERERSRQNNTQNNSTISTPPLETRTAQSSLFVNTEAAVALN